MKNLDLLNPEIAQPRTFASLIAVLPFLLGLVCLPLAFDAAPSRSFAGNFLAIGCAGQSVIALFLIFIPRIFLWDWRSKYFGTPLLYVGSVGLVGIVPWLSIVFFSNLPIWTRLLLFGAYTATIIWWCRRFVIYYRRIFSEEPLRRILYEEDDDAIYYLQQGDKFLFEKRLKLEQMPTNEVFVCFAVLALLSTPFAQQLRSLAGIPFIHIFLTILGLPIILMCLGLAVRGYLIFYYYPWRLKQLTGKEVYVLMATTVHAKRRKT